MKIQTTNGEVHSALDALVKVAALSMPITLALRVRRLIRILRPDGIEIETERQALIEKYVDRDAAGTPKPALDGNQNPIPGRLALADPEAYGRAENELFSGQLEVDVEPLTTSEIALMDGSITPGILMALGQFLRDSPDVAAADNTHAASKNGRNGARRPARART